MRSQPRGPYGLPTFVVVALVGLLLIFARPALTDAQTLPATPIQPLNGATDVDLLDDIQWTAVPTAEAYYLYVGTVPGANDLINSGEIQQTSYPSLGLPSGTLVYARLWTKVTAAWLSVDFSFTTSSTMVFGFVHPAPSSIEADMTRPFEWTAVPGAEAYCLYVGTTPGAKDLIDSSEIQQSSYLAFNLPTGVPLYARIWTKVSGLWRFADTAFTATATATQVAAFLHPTDGTVNANLSLPFRWTTAVDAQAYYLYVGTAPGLKDLVDTGETLATSFSSPVLPSGQPLYGRLWTKSMNGWQHVDITFTVDPSAAGSVTIATFLNPPGGGAQIDPAQPIKWASVAEAEAYYLYVGTAPGLNDLINTGEMQATSYPPWTLPASGTFYARIYTKLRGFWLFSEIVFTSAPTTATLLTPVDGGLNIDPTQMFQWTSVPARETYYLYVGSAQGEKDLIDSEETPNTSWSGLKGGKGPGLGNIWNSRKLHARLWTKIEDVWRFEDTTFTTVPLAAEFQYPLNRAVKVDLHKPFRWDSVPNAQAYRLTIERICRGRYCTSVDDDEEDGRNNNRGRKEGERKRIERELRAARKRFHRGELILDTGPIRRTSVLVRDLPRRGDLHARLWTKVGGTWRYTDIVFTRKKQLNDRE